MFKKVIYNTSAQVVAKFISASITLIVTLIIAKSLGPAGFGDFSKIFVFVGYFYTFADFGLNTAFIKLTKEDSNFLFRSLLGLRIVLAASLVLVAIATSQLLPYNEATSTGFNQLAKVGIAIASLTIITQALFTTANAFFQKKLRYDFSAIATIFGSLAILVLTIFTFFGQNALLMYVWAYVAGGIVYVLSAFVIIARKYQQNLAPVFNLQQAKKIATFAWPVGAALVVNLVYFRLDVFILANLKSSADVGIYNLAYQFFQAGLAVPIFFANALFPLLTILYAKNRENFKNEVKKWAYILLAISLVETITLYIISYLIPVFFDSRFADSAMALRILSSGMPLFFLSALAWHVIIIGGRQKALIAIYAASAVFNLVANLIFIPQYSYVAASVITLISEAIVLLLSLLVINFKTVQKT